MLKVQGKTIGVAMTGSLCTIGRVLPHIEELVRQGAKVIPVFSQTVACTDSKYGTAAALKEKVEAITNSRVITTLVDVEPLGPGRVLDVIAVVPCTGNTMAKIANAITDGPVTMAVKAHLRNSRPVVISISTNDGLSLNAKNLGTLLAARNIYFVPFRQDNPRAKPYSIDAELSLLLPTIESALDGVQLQPLLLGEKA
ncbi:MAG: dipicolinate synthase subunit B [Bacillota bacterium]